MVDDRTEDERRTEFFAGQFGKWLQDATTKAVEWSILEPVSLESNAATLTKLDDQSILASGDRHKIETYTVCFETDVKNITALRLEALPHPSLPRGGPGRYDQESEGDFFLTDFRVFAAPTDTSDSTLRRIDIAKATADYHLASRKPDGSLDGSREAGWSISPQVGKAHAAVFQLAEPLPVLGKTKLKLVLKHEYFNASNSLGRFRVSVTNAPGPVEASGVTAEMEDLLCVSPSERTDEQHDQLKQFYLKGAPETAPRRLEIQALRDQMPKYPTTLTMRERLPEHQRVTRRHHRGEYTSPKEEVVAGVPASLPQLPEGAEANRFSLARWLVDRRNPLTARVVMNRTWQAFFGLGIVETVEDFGVQGSNPTHPDLLDSLAVKFMDEGWRMKEMHRLMVTSAVYRQASHMTPENLAKDPRNELLARGPRFRVEAEMVRDMALAASGLLANRLGGPSVRPPNAGGITELAYSNDGDGQSTGDDLYRRGLYTYWKRTVPYATLMAFDAPSADIACVKRNRSNSPLQALTILNDLVYTETAQAMAHRILTEAPQDTAQRIRFLFKITLSRVPSTAELTTLSEYYEKQLARLRTEEIDAGKIALSHRPDADLKNIDKKDLAAWTLVCRAILNLNEMITKG